MPDDEQSRETAAKPQRLCRGHLPKALDQRTASSTEKEDASRKRVLCNAPAPAAKGPPYRCKYVEAVIGDRSSQDEGDVSLPFAWAAVPLPIVATLRVLTSSWQTRIAGCRYPPENVQRRSEMFGEGCSWRRY
jgi:hypothetical protein